MAKGTTWRVRKRHPGIQATTMWADPDCPRKTPCPSRRPLRGGVGEVTCYFIASDFNSRARHPGPFSHCGRSAPATGSTVPAPPALVVAAPGHSSFLERKRARAVGSPVEAAAALLERQPFRCGRQAIRAHCAAGDSVHKGQRVPPRSPRGRSETCGEREGRGRPADLAGLC